MKITTRRVSLFACSMALNGVFIASPPATVPIFAARCQQECDAEYGPSCVQNCDDTFADSASQQSCINQCNQFWNSCTSSAVDCSPPPANCMQGYFDYVTYDSQFLQTYGAVWSCVVEIGYSWGSC